MSTHFIALKQSSCTYVHVHVDYKLANLYTTKSVSSAAFIRSIRERDLATTTISGPPPYRNSAKIFMSTPNMYIQLMKTKFFCLKKLIYPYQLKSDSLPLGVLIFNISVKASTASIPKQSVVQHIFAQNTVVLTSTPFRSIKFPILALKIIN